MKFLDEVRIHVAAGDGGNGCVAFLHEKFRPRGGPAGGDGGIGGDIIAVADGGINTLAYYRFRRRFRAEGGADGSGKSRHGRNGQELRLSVPVGTTISDEDSGQRLADLTVPGASAVVAHGGRGGRGNARFATPTNQAPQRADAGTPGESRNLVLELRLLADAGLVGLPNAGKSSLLSHVSAARPKIADYPFTTTEPILGVVSLDEERSFVLADIPGLIEGAHRGRGLGDRFLRHLQRTEVLVHLVDSSGRDSQQILAAYQRVRDELAQYDEELAKRPEIVVLTKCDLIESAERLQSLRTSLARRNIEARAISSHTGMGCRELASVIHQTITEARRNNA